jgi:uncharacterized protein (DUF433 family)
MKTAGFSLRTKNEHMKPIHEGWIIRSPDLFEGRAFIRNTNLTVEYILDQLVDGKSENDLLQLHPELSKQGIAAAIDYALAVMNMDEIVEMQP